MKTKNPRLLLRDRWYFFSAIAFGIAFLALLQSAQAQEAIASDLKAPVAINSNGDLLPVADINMPAVHTSKWSLADWLREVLGVNPFSDDLEVAVLAARRASVTTASSTSANRIIDPPSPLSTVYNWGSATSSNYNNPAQWSPNGVPLNPGDAGVVPVQAGTTNYTITLDVNPNIDSFNIQDSKATLDLNGQTMTTSGGLTNSGTISSGANGSTLAGATVTNNATIQSTGGFSLVLSSGVSNSSTGHIDVGGTGSSIIQNGVTITGGTINQSGTGAFQPTNSGSNVLDGVTVTGAIDMATNIGTEKVVNGLTLNGGAVNISSGSLLAFFNDQTLGGTNGNIVFGSGGGHLSLEGNIALTIGSNVTLHGQTGAVGGAVFSSGTQQIINNGTISADVSGGTITLQVSNSAANAISNAGTISARNGGTLSITNNITNTGSGHIDAGGAGTGSTVLQNGATITGGTVNQLAGGSFVPANNGSNVFDGVTVTGAIDLATNIGEEKVINGLTLNGGTVNISSSSLLAFFNDQTLGGSNGNIVFGAGGGQLSQEGNSVLTIGPNVTIHGTNGQIGGARISGGTQLMINNGTISADVSGGNIVLAVGNSAANALTNNATLSAINGGTLTLSNNVTNGTNGHIDAGGSGTGSLVIQNGVTITGGTINQFSGGSFRPTNNASNFLDSVTVNGTFDMATTTGRERIVNATTLNGNISLDVGSILSFQGDQTLSGGGTVTFGSDASTHISLEGNAVFTIGPNVTVHGNNGLIGPAVYVGGTQQLVNNGTIKADVAGGTITLQINNSAADAIKNAGTLAARNGGNLGISNNITNTSTGHIDVIDAGSTIVQNGYTVTGGTINQTNGGAFKPANNSNNFLDGVTFNGNLDMASATSRERIVNNTTLNGNIALDVGSILSFQGDQTLNGVGTITFGNDASTHISLEGNAVFTINTGVLIHGKNGLIGPAVYIGGTEQIVNNGTISADVAGGTITLQVNNSAADAIKNTATLSAANGGNLLIQNNVTNTSSGHIDVIGAGSTIVQNGITITGGTINQSLGGAFTPANNSNNFLDGVTVNGDFDMATNTGRERIVNDTVLNGNIRIDKGSILSFQGNQTLNGTGMITFGSTASGNQISLEGNAIFTIGPGVLIHGQNGIIGPAVYIGGTEQIVNNGTISADVAGGNITLQVNNSAANAISNGGTLSATNGGQLTIQNNITQSSVGHIDVSGTGSLISQNGYTVTGGIINQSANGAFRPTNNSNNFFDGVTYNGILDMASATARERLLDGLTLNGTINIDNNSVLSAQGDNTLGGNGTVTFGSSGSNLFTIEGNGTLTIGANVLIHGQNGFIGNPQQYNGGTTKLVNAGTIAADTGAGTIQVNPNSGAADSISNSGTLAAKNGSTLQVISNVTNSGTFLAVDSTHFNQTAALANYDSGTQTMTGGTYQVVSTGVASALNLNIGQIVNNAASIILDGANTIIHTSDGTSDALTSFNNNTATGSFTITNGRNFDRTFAFNNAGIVTVGPNSLFTTVHFDLSGTLTGAGTLTDTGSSTFNWTAGTQSGTGITNADDMIIATTANKFLDARTLNIGVLGTWSGADNISAGNGAIINNTGTFNASASQSITFSGVGTAASFNNSGIFNKTGAATTTSIDAIFNDSGSVNINSGTLELKHGGTDTGTFADASGAALSFNGGTHSITGGAAGVSGAGDVNFLAGTVNFSNSANYNIAGVTTINGGTASFANAAFGAVTNLISGTLTGAGTYNSGGLFTWGGGTMSGSGITNANAGLTMNGNTKTLSARTLNNNTAATWSAGNISSGQGATINNVNGASFDNSFDGSVLFDQGGTRTLFTNNGTFTKSAGTGTTLVEATFNNTNVVNANSGTLELAGGGSNGSAFNIANNAKIQIQLNDYSVTTGAVISGPGTFEMTSANTTFTGTQTNSAAFLIDGGTATFNGTTSTSGATTLSSGTLTGTGTFTDTGSFTWGGGAMSGAGITNANNGLTLNGSTKTFTQRTLNNNGSATWSAGGIAAGLGAIFNNPLGSTFTNSADLNWLFNQGGTLTQFNNGGTFTKSAGTGTTTMQVNFSNTGILNASSGTLAFSQGVQGTSGTVNIGASGTLDVSGGTTASSAATLADNGNLSLGSNNFNVASDYTNANFGTGNTFNPRANVTGSGGINATGNVNQTITGNISGGTGTTPLIAFGNFHVGDSSVTKNYAINNTGSSGPVLRGAIQTSANGGNITDGRLSGTGVTAANFGPLALGGNTGNLGVTFNPSSAGALNGQVVHLINNFDNVQDQNLSITGAVFRLASANAHSPEPVTLANQHVGDSVTQAISITNTATNDGFSEKLDASFTGTTGNATASGFFNLLAPGATNNTSLLVGVDTSAAGARSGTATIGLVSDGTGTSGLTNSNLTSQTVNVSGNVYRLASPSTHSPEPVDFGVRHVNDSVSNVAVSLKNNAANDGFSESLNASIATGTTGLTATGSFTGLAPGSTDSSSLSVGMNTTSAGARNGTATITLKSDGTGSSGLGLTNLTSQTVNITGQVNFFADPVVIFKSGSATLTMNSPTSFTLNFGQVAQNSGTYMASFGVQNFLHDGTYQDSLGGTFNTTNVTNFGITGAGPFANIAPGSALDPNVTFDSSQATGNYSNTFTLSPTSSNASGTSNLADVQVTLLGQIVVVPEPNTWAMLLAGGGLLTVARRFVRRRE